MEHNYKTLAEAFYKAFAEKNSEAMEQHLHPDVELQSPLSTLQGKTAYLEAVKSFLPFFNTITIHKTFADGHHAVIVYDMDCADPIGLSRAAAFVTFQDGLIIRNELFHDTTPFQKLQGDFLA